jgi:hypothetical protein
MLYTAFLTYYGDETLTVVAIPEDGTQRILVVA